ncbi:hypothetical protein XALC_0180 [Xanthomonas albilineans GPE PC73]|uniref:Uncharacterized protein n=1 Tax=Xanthomonas albilineans (strain GPE PC73 / CFBP 7063) TaxID=380358 RepID=D2U8S0_XANAP|nr:hypothetical protein XALC_0180 [Xanthomonas albilineans GPE PC73]
MNGQLVQFPRKYQLRRLKSACLIAAGIGWNVSGTRAWMIEKAYSQFALNYLSEIAREIRTQKAMEARNG